MTEMNYRVDLDFIGRGGAGAAYGGFLRAWSFRDVDGRQWFEEFRQKALAAVGCRFLPVYRMADGEYRFLMGRTYNWARRPSLTEFAAVTAEKLRLKDPDNWKTSWGETYTPAETRRLRAELIGHIRYLAERGYLACYLNDNGLNAFTEHNRLLLRYFARHRIAFGMNSYIPFHFAPSLLISAGWRDFIAGRSILIVTGLNPDKEQRIARTLAAMGAGTVRFLPISAHSSMTDAIDLNAAGGVPDLCLVAAGIGSANILRQLEPLQTLTLDIGGLMNCFADTAATQHGGVIALPDL